MWTSWLSTFRFESPPAFDAKISVDVVLGLYRIKKKRPVGDWKQGDELRAMEIQ